MMDFEIKLTVTEGQYKAIVRYCEALGMTVAGGARHALIHQVVDHEDRVSRSIELTGRPENLMK